MYVNSGKRQAISDFPNISLSRKSLKPAVGDSPSPEKTADGYELCSRGPATLGPDALDIAPQVRGFTSHGSEFK
jgi:hypothetical protein